MAVLNDIEDVMSVFGAPTVKILLLSIGGQIDETTFTAAFAGKRLFHNLSCFSPNTFNLGFKLARKVNLRCFFSTSASTNCQL
jgi:hypothetical protein